RDWSSDVCSSDLLLTWSRLPRKEPDLDRDALRALAESRDRKTWRGKDLRKLTLPWTTREVVFTCANGWTIERIHEADRWLEGLRSEEHTSELQSRSELVCRLLLEKKTMPDLLGLPESCGPRSTESTVRDRPLAPLRPAPSQP